MAFSTIIKNGTIIDGTGESAYHADVGIVDDKIAFIGEIEYGIQAEETIDATGKFVVPGFIDTHSHADCSAFLYPDCESYLRQGITTFIGGQCGDSNAPIHNWWMRKYWEYDMWHDIDPFVYTPRTIQPVERVLDVVHEKTDYRIGWRSFGEYADVIEKAGLGCNMITLAGHSQIRADVMGLDQARPPTGEEMKRIKEHIDEAFAAGVWGFSTGRDYPPSAYAEVAEIVELAEYVKNLGGYYFTHWKRTGVRVGTPKKPNKRDGIVEALEIALAAGIKTQISHLSTAFDIYPADPAMDAYAAEVTLRLIDEYIERGADAAFDVIPGCSGGICIDPHLASLFVPWIKQSGSLDQFSRNLAARDYRERLIDLLRRGEWYALNPLANPSWDKKIVLLEAGKSIREFARESGCDALELVMDILAADPLTTIRKFDKSDEEVRGLLRHERGFVCTDTYAFDLRGTYGNEGEFAEILPHPHTYCAFPKYIQNYAPERFEDAIRKITGAPAEFMEIKDRGLLKEGGYADVVVLDLKNLKTNESYVEPRTWPEGIDFVLVNGRTVVDKSGYRGRRAGVLLKK